MTVMPVEDIIRFRDDIVRRFILFLFFLVVLVSTGSFAPKLVSPSDGAFLQQAFVEVLWIAIIAVAAPRIRSIRFEPDIGLFLVIALVFYAALSALWSGAGAQSLMKAVALSVNVFGVFVLLGVVGFAAMVDTAIAGLFALIAGSLFLVVLFPEIAILETWMHAGQWQGIFDQKQTLGITSAILLFVSAMRWSAQTSAAGRVYHGIVMLAAVICLIGSGSRGGGILAGGAVVLSLMASWNRQAEVLMGWIPAAATLVAAGLYLTLFVTGHDYIPIGDAEIDFTERTQIWKHAIDYMSLGGILFGSGINGFWSRKEVEDMFLGAHGWFLDNFHSGYLAVFTECGLIGAMLFVAVTALLVARSAPSRLMSDANGRRSEQTLVFGFLALIYVINLTETYFLRSTNFISIMSFGFLFHLFAGPRSDFDADDEVEPGRLAAEG